MLVVVVAALFHREHAVQVAQVAVAMAQTAVTQTPLEQPTRVGVGALVLKPLTEMVQQAVPVS